MAVECRISPDCVVEVCNCSNLLYVTLINNSVLLSRYYFWCLTVTVLIVQCYSDTVDTECALELNCTAILYYIEALPVDSSLLKYHQSSTNSGGGSN